jgi:hypothetical protein
MKKENVKEVELLKPYRILYLLISVTVMVVNAGLASYFLILGETDEYVVLNSEYRIILFVLLFASLVLIPLSVVLMFLEKNKWSFWTSLVSALVITYVGFFLLGRESEIPFKTVALYQGTSLLLPLYSGIYWASYKKRLKQSGKVIFAKTEKQTEEKMPSILD